VVQGETVSHGGGENVKLILREEIVDPKCKLLVDHGGCCGSKRHLLVFLGLLVPEEPHPMGNVQ